MHKLSRVERGLICSLTERKLKQKNSFLPCLGVSLVLGWVGYCQTSGNLPMACIWKEFREKNEACNYKFFPLPKHLQKPRYLATLVYPTNRIKFALILCTLWQMRPQVFTKTLSQSVD